MKTDIINLTNWECITLYELLKTEYCNIVDSSLKNEEVKQVLKAYKKLMDKLECAIAHTNME